MAIAALRRVRLATSCHATRTHNHASLLVQAALAADAAPQNLAAMLARSGQRPMRHGPMACARAVIKPHGIHKERLPQRAMCWQAIRPVEKRCINVADSCTPFPSLGHARA